MLSWRGEWLNEQATPALLNERMNGVARRAVQKVQVLRENLVSGVN